MSRASFKFTAQEVFNILCVAVVVALIVIVFQKIQRINLELTSIKSGVSAQSHQDRYDHDRLEFCYEHNIHPCDDGAITSWNKAHPSAVFTLKTSQQIIEEAGSPSLMMR